MAAEVEPRDGVGAMLVVRLTTTRVAMAGMARRMMDTTAGAQLRESLER